MWDQGSVKGRDQGAEGWDPDQGSQAMGSGSAVLCRIRKQAVV